MSDQFEDLVVEGIRTSQGMDTVRKDVLANKAGLRYHEFRATLTPKFYLVWVHLLAGHIALALAALATMLLSHELPRLNPVTVVVAGICFGYTHAYIHLFIHEGAHYNLMKSRKLNDILANIFVGSLVGLDIKTYRSIHFDHHRYLGMPQDTEHTYFDPLNVRFVVECMTGIRPLKAVFERKKVVREKQAGAASKVKGGSNSLLLRGAVLHLLIIGGSIWGGYRALALAWILGMAVFFPFFHSVRQLLEHRDEHAVSGVDYRTTAHGAVNRIFGDGPLASTLGGAGFN